MSRLLFLVAIVALIYLLLKSYRRASRRPVAPDEAEDMVRCAQCGVHLPKGESIAAGGQHYCSEAHRIQADARRD
jgi:uncharacterized protein